MKDADLPSSNFPFPIFRWDPMRWSLERERENFHG
jgi:hypothetical protein